MRHAYSQYQQTDIGWIGDVPKHWSKKKFKYLLSEKPKTQNIELSCGSISFGSVVYKDSEKLTEETKLAYQEVLSGEFLVNPLNLNYDLKSLRTALSEIDVIVSSGYIVLKSEGVVDKNYLKWLLFVFDIRQMKTLGAGIRQTITFRDIGNCTTYIPSCEEQKFIAIFLDGQIARIDNLIAEKQDFISLLKEKQQTLISHVVTKGLAPKVKMKDSGIEWIGRVPKHWAVGALGYYATLNTGATPERDKSEYWGGDIPWLSTSEVRYKTITESNEYITELGLSNSSTRISPPGTLVMAMYGQGVTRGRVAILGIHAAYNQACVAISPNSKVLNEYLQYFYIAAYNEIRVTGNLTSQMNLNAYLVGKFKIIVPPMNEQYEVVKFLNEEKMGIDTLEQETERSIELLKEYRTALISAAVTGKFDVRNYKEEAS